MMMEYVSTRAEGPLGAPLCMVIVVIWLDVPEIMLVTIWEMNWYDRPGLLEGHAWHQKIANILFLNFFSFSCKAFVDYLSVVRIL